MYKFYTYLNKKTSKLTISINVITDEDHFLLMDNSSNDYKTALTAANCFCLGYITGNHSEKVLNDPKEFIDVLNNSNQ